MSILTIPEPLAADSERAKAPSMVADDAKTGGMPMTTQLPGLWTESPLLNTEPGQRR
ncbi:MAG: hypothetical protein R3E87_22515 [Burkholderiaceae bacterium]